MKRRPPTLAELLDSFRTRTLADGSRHLPNCRIGQYVDGYSHPNGAPCSKKCAAVAAALAAHQPPLWEKEAS